MVAKISDLVTVYCCGFILTQIGGVQPQLIKGLLGTVENTTENLVSNVTSLLEGPLNCKLCGSNTVIKDIWIDSMTSKKNPHFFSMI